MRVAIVYDPGGSHWDAKDVAAAVDGTRVGPGLTCAAWGMRR